MTFIPYRLGSDPRFEACLLDTELEEGPIPWSAGPMPRKDYTDDPHDSGGMTGEGITQREYDAQRKAWGQPTRWVFNMSKDEERTIYHQSYWLPHCAELPAGLNLCLFDTNVNNGVHAGTVLLQRTLRIPDDGDWGPWTRGAVNALLLGSNGTDEVIDRFSDARLAYYKSLRQWGRYGKDWGRREEHVRNWAHALVARSGDKPALPARLAPVA